MDHAFGIVSKNLQLYPKSSSFFAVFSYRSFILVFYIQVYDPFWINFCEEW